jgi:hypothetical protein
VGFVFENEDDKEDFDGDLDDEHIDVAPMTVDELKR